MNPSLITPEPSLVASVPGPIAITGAGGLIGGHVAALLAASGRTDVRCLVGRRPPPFEASYQDIVTADLRDAAETQGALKGCKSLIHAAGKVATAPVLAADPLGPVFDTVRIALSVLEASRAVGIERIVMMSSTTGYGPGSGDLTEDDMEAGDPPGRWYGLGWATRYVETAARHLAEHLDGGPTVTALRPTMVYGPYDDVNPETSHFLPAMMLRVLRRERPITVLGDGRTERDLVHASDVARASLSALRRQNGFRAYTIGAGRAASVLEIIDLLRELDGFHDAELRHVPFSGATPVRRRFSIERARTELGYRPSVALPDGLKQTMDWVRSVN